MLVALKFPEQGGVKPGACHRHGNFYEHFVKGVRKLPALSSLQSSVDKAFGNKLRKEEEVGCGGTCEKDGEEGLKGRKSQGEEPGADSEREVGAKLSEKGGKEEPEGKGVGGKEISVGAGLHLD